MKILLLIVLSFYIVVVDGFFKQSAASDLTAKSGILYLTPSRTDYIKINKNLAELGQFDASDTSAEPTVVDTNAMALVNDCSSHDMICIHISNQVFAVPRVLRKTISNYYFYGTKFKLLKCYRSSAAKCLVALIESNCERVIRPGECARYSGGRESSPHPGPVVYFIYNWRYGVTAFGVFPQLAGSVNEAEQFAATSILQGQVGILAGSNN